MFLAFPEVSLPRRLLAKCFLLAKARHGTSPSDWRTFGVRSGPHPPARGDAITSHLWPLLISYAKRFAKNGDDMSRQKLRKPNRPKRDRADGAQNESGTGRNSVVPVCSSVAGIHLRHLEGMNRAQARMSAPSSATQGGPPSPRLRRRRWSWRSRLRRRRWSW
jgi:hypothetical protein